MNAQNMRHVKPTLDFTYKKLRLNMFSSFHFSFSKKFFQLLVFNIFSIFTFGPSFKVNSYVEFIFFNKILQKNLKYYKNLPKKKLEFFYQKMNLIWIFIFLTVKNSYLIRILLKNSNFFWEILLHIYAQFH